MTHPQTNPVSRAGNLLGLSWHDSQFIPLLNPANVLDYFSERSNPFYDKTCNNEIIKMQRLNPSHLSNMEGIEYVLLHVQEPVLYVIRKQHRHTNGQVTPLNDYYIIAGVVYQAPDLGSIINSRLMTTINHLQSAFDECLSYTRYHPSKGYSWEFKDKDEDKSTKKREKAVDPSSMFQRQRVDVLLMELTKKFPHRTAQSDIPQKTVTTAVVEDAVKADGKENTVAKQDVNVNNAQAQVQNSQQAPTQQRMKPPPEKKPRLN